ncbi:hypothetical protein C4E24_00985 [ANME-1 cluster archaeon AG-394-G21]|nr:hypothetical protein [ANME-1 cluster archaeon AG-394-G21]
MYRIQTIMTGYTKIENKILERIVTSDFTKGQLKILFLILRLSSGCQKPGAVLRKGDLSLAGIEADRRIMELERLSLLNVVKFMRLSRGRKVIWINRNTDEWALNRVKSEKRLKREFFKLVASNIPKLFLLKALWKKVFGLFQN